MADRWLSTKHDLWKRELLAEIFKEALVATSEEVEAEETEEIEAEDDTKDWLRVMQRGSI
jgi:hypothetical protein